MPSLCRAGRLRSTAIKTALEVAEEGGKVRAAVEEKVRVAAVKVKVKGKGTSQAWRAIRK